MKKGDLLFVYGTLRKGASNDLSRKEGAKYIGEDWINGDLYDLGWYPGVKLFEGAENFSVGLPVVVGDVFAIEDTKLADYLDGYEGYPNLYNRSQVETSGGHIVWVYIYNHGVYGRENIPTGDWLSHEAIIKNKIPNQG